VELPADVDVHAGFDESEDVGPVGIPGYEDPLSRNKPENTATPYIQRGYAAPASEPVPPAGGYPMDPCSVPGLYRARGRSR
jgi:hypothetical protein